MRASWYSTSRANQINTFQNTLQGALYLVGREQQDISAWRIHLVTLSRMDSFLLHCLYLQWFQFLIKNLTLEDKKLSSWQLDQINFILLNPWQRSHELDGDVSDIFEQKTIDILFCHKWARNIWIKLIFKVGIFPCLRAVSRRINSPDLVNVHAYTR